MAGGATCSAPSEPEELFDIWLCELFCWVDVLYFIRGGRYMSRRGGSGATRGATGSGAARSGAARSGAATGSHLIWAWALILYVLVEYRSIEWIQPL
jgi:hypothetical protein